MRGIFFPNLVVLFSVFAFAGCANVIVKSDSDPNVNLGEFKTFYVQNFTPDKRELEKIIAGKLNAFGFNATSGVSPTPPGPVDVLVTYRDRWMWDITNYMLEITIEFHDPESNFTFASGRSYRTSLARKDPEVMIEEVLQDLFKRKADNSIQKQ
jgi:hypothetical protein